MGSEWNLEKAMELVGENPDSNCWGMTAFLLGWREEPAFMEASEMYEYLKEIPSFQAGEGFQKGDISAQFMTDEEKVEWGDSVDGNEGLIHTAVYVGADKWLHQCGHQGPVFMEEFSPMKRRYGFRLPGGGPTAYYRSVAA